MPRSSDDYAARYLARARTDLTVAKELAEQGYYRVAVDVARGAARAALRAADRQPRAHPTSHDFTVLLGQALTENEALRRLHDQGLTRLITQYAFDEEADEEDARHAIEAASGIVEFVVSRQAAT